MTKKTAGYLVETKDGKQGRTYHSKGTINGKIPVYVDGEKKPRLCNRDNLRIKGFLD